MKTNWIKRGAPVMALLFLAAFGMISCSTDPVSSPDTQSSTFTMQSEGTTVPESPATAGTDETLITGHLRMDETGWCWYLIVSPFEVYELKLARRIRAENNGREASVMGLFPGNIQPRCSSWEVFKVSRVILL